VMKKDLHGCPRPVGPAVAVDRIQGFLFGADDLAREVAEEWGRAMLQRYFEWEEVMRLACGNWWDCIGSMDSTWPVGMSEKRRNFRKEQAAGAYPFLGEGRSRRRT